MHLGHHILNTSPCLLCRWLLLDFKREFSFDESIRLFEVLSSHYLELNSDKAILETDKVIAREFELDGENYDPSHDTVTGHPQLAWTQYVTSLEFQPLRDSKLNWR